MLLRFILFGLFTILCCSRFTWCQRRKGYYTIVAPGTIRPGCPYQVAISLSDFHQSCWFNVTIKEKHSREVTTVEVEPGTTKLVKIAASSIVHGRATLIVNGWRGIISRDVARLNVEEHFMVFIQTSKSKYRPGEVMQFRVICIDRMTHPAKVTHPIRVLIYDGDKNVVKYFPNVQLKRGVFKGELQISEYPVLGDWKIEVKSRSLRLEEKTFQVAKYTLSTFSVIIISKKDFSLSEGHFGLKIKASYSYGEPVNGSLTIFIRSTYSAYEEPQRFVVKELQIDGDIEVKFDFKTDLKIQTHTSEPNPLRLFTFEVEAVVKDSLTSQISKSKTDIEIHRHPFKINVKAPEFFELDKITNITVSVTDIEDNPIKDAKNKISVTFEGRPFATTGIRMMSNGETSGQTLKNITTHRLDENGIAKLFFNFTIPNILEYAIYVEYLGCRSRTKTLVKQVDNTFELEVLTDRPEVGKELVIRLQSLDVINHFVYSIIARGDILQTERINVPKNGKIHLLRVNVTYSMVPKLTLYVYRVQNKTFDARLKDIYVKRALQNSIHIEADREVKPGSVVNLKVSTDNDSYVGLMGIDHNLLSETNTNNDLNEDNLFTQLRNYDSINMNTVEHPGYEAGLITFSNALNRAGSSIGEQFIPTIIGGAAYPLPAPLDKPSTDFLRVRKLFSESWIFQEFERTPPEGLRIRKTIPDTITSWAITGFSLNPKTGLAFTKNATTIKVFQAFFISMNLPTSIKEGETLEIPIYVFNYLNEDVLVNVTVEQQSNELQFFESLGSTAEAKFNQAKSVLGNGSAEIIFFCRPRRPGRYNITAKAIASIASDAIQKTLVVEAQGIPQTVSKTSMIHFLENGEKEDDILLNIPEGIAQGSESVHLSLIGDICGRLMKRLEKLVRVPIGNGEENMRYTVASLLVLKYLKTLNYSNPCLENKTKLYLELGYQTQLTFKHLDGSFSFIDRKFGRTGDVWLTSFVIWGLQQVSLFIYVDQRVVTGGLDYLRFKQCDSGGFSSGRGLDEDVKLTALTLLAFLVNENTRHQYEDVISKGLGYLCKAKDDLKYITPVALSAYVSILAKHEKSEKLFGKLFSLGSLKGKQITWTKRESDTLQSSLEQTAVNFLNLLESQNGSGQNLLQIVRALVLEDQGERSPIHMIALEAMIHFARHMNFANENLDIQLSNDQGGTGSFHIGNENAQVLQMVKLEENTHRIRIHANGTGYAVIEIKHVFNLRVDCQLSANFQTNLTTKRSTESSAVLEACIAIRTPGLQNNLTGMEVTLQSGYSMKEYMLNDVPMLNRLVKSVQLKGHGSSALFYLENVGQDGTCIQLEAFRAFKVYNATLTSIVVYDVHRMDQKTIDYCQMDIADQ